MPINQRVQSLLLTFYFQEMRVSSVLIFNDYYRNGLK